MNKARCALASAALLLLGAPDVVASTAEGALADDSLWSAPVVVDDDGGVHPGGEWSGRGGWALNLPAIGNGHVDGHVAYAPPPVPLLKDGGDGRTHLRGAGS